MSKSYETERRMRAASIGTILPWTGSAQDKPDGWIECNGQTLEAVDYPVLASVIGNTYGPTGGLNGRSYGSYLLGDQFRLPTLNGRVLVDYEADYLSQTALQMGQNYASGAVGGINIIRGEVDLQRNSKNPATLTNGSANLVNGTGVSGTGLQLNVSCNSAGRVGIDSIVASGSGFAQGNQFTIPASFFPNGTEDVVIEVQWVLPSVADVLTPTGTGTTQLIAGNGDTSTPPTSANATADINFVVSDSSNLTAQIKNFSVNPPAYFKSFYTVPRKLCMDHMPSHRHANPTGASGYSSITADGGFVEGFQCPTFGSSVEGNQKQLSLTPGYDTVLPGIGYVTTYVEGKTAPFTEQATKITGNSIGGGNDVDQPIWSGPHPRPLNGNSGAGGNCNYREAAASGRFTNRKNWYGNQSANQIANASGASKTYPTCLNHNSEDHTGIRSHNHYSFEVTMNAGFLRTPTIVPVDDIQIDSTLTGAATNVGIQNLPASLNINVDIKTPSLTMIYLIRAF